MSWRDTDCWDETRARRVVIIARMIDAAGEAGTPADIVSACLSVASAHIRQAPAEMRMDLVEQASALLLANVRESLD